MDKLSLIVTLLVVSVFAIFTGYLVGQYAIYWLAAPIVGEARQEPSGTQFVASDPLPAPAATPTAPSQPSSAQREQASGSTPAAPTAPSTGATSSSAPAQTAQPSVYRVQVGRFSTQSAAGELLQTLKQSVPDAWVVFDAPSREYRVQAGAFSSRARAEEFVQELAARGHDAYIAP